VTRRRDASPLPTALLASALACAACHQGGPADASLDDAAVSGLDDSPPDTARPDRDNDGLCDDTEAYFRSDPDSVDTDHDGLSDGFEIDIYSSPLSATDPPPEDRLTIRERPGEAAALMYDFVYVGQGESVVGLVLDEVASVDQRQATQLGASVAALGADPRSFVGDIVGATFLGVSGRVRLRWSFDVAWPALPPLRCRRAYMAYGAAFVQDQGIIYGHRAVIDVLPDDGTDGDAGAGGADAGVLPDAGERGGGGGGDDSGATDAAVAIPSPWPYVAQGFCVPPPGHCR
jgi:hypothetical protein